MSVSELMVALAEARRAVTRLTGDLLCEEGRVAKLAREAAQAAEEAERLRQENGQLRRLLSVKGTT